MTTNEEINDLKREIEVLRELNERFIKNLLTKKQIKAFKPMKLNKKDTKVMKLWLKTTHNLEKLESEYCTNVYKEKIKFGNKIKRLKLVIR